MFFTLFTTTKKYYYIFVACYDIDFVAARKGRGKSGQRRAVHHLTDGFCRNTKTESATENNRRYFIGKGENVR